MYIFLTVSIATGATYMFCNDHDCWLCPFLGSGIQVQHVMDTQITNLLFADDELLLATAPPQVTQMLSDLRREPKLSGLTKHNYFPDLVNS